MHVIEYKDYQIVPTQEAFLIKPIRDLYKKDKTKNKDNFMQALSIIYFMADPRSSYSYIIDEKDRLKEILIQEGLSEKFKLSDSIIEAIKAYKKHTVTLSYLLLQDTKIAIDNLRKFLRDINLNDVDDKGKPLYTISSVVQAIKQIPQLSKALLEAEQAVAKEIEETGRMRGTGQRTIMEDGILT